MHIKGIEIDQGLDMMKNVFKVIQFVLEGTPTSSHLGLKSTFFPVVRGKTLMESDILLRLLLNVTQEVFECISEPIGANAHSEGKTGLRCTNSPQSLLSSQTSHRLAYMAPQIF